MPSQSHPDAILMLASRLQEGDVVFMRPASESFRPPAAYTIQSITDDGDWRYITMTDEWEVSLLSNELVTVAVDVNLSPITSGDSTLTDIPLSGQNDVLGGPPGLLSNSNEGQKSRKATQEDADAL